MTTTSSNYIISLFFNFKSQWILMVKEVQTVLMLVLCMFSDAIWNYDGKYPPWADFSHRISIGSNQYTYGCNQVIYEPWSSVRYNYACILILSTLRWGFNYCRLSSIRQIATHRPVFSPWYCLFVKCIFLFYFFAHCLAAGAAVDKPKCGPMDAFGDMTYK